MTACGISDQSDTVWIEAEIGTFGAEELDRSLHIVDSPRVSPDFGKPIRDFVHGITVLGQVWTPMLIRCTAPVLPAAAMNPNYHRRFCQPLRQIEIAAE